jgi:hypothetical protein
MNSEGQVEIQIFLRTSIMHSPTEEQECRILQKESPYLSLVGRDDTSLGSVDLSARLIWGYGATFTKGVIVFGLDDHFSCQRHVNARMSSCEGL